MRTTKKRLWGLLGGMAALMAVSVSGNARASLIGDDVTVTYFNRFNNSVVASETAMATNGLGPEVTLDTSPFNAAYTIDYEASSIEIEWVDPQTGSSGFTVFDVEFRFTSLDWLGVPDGALVSASLDIVGGDTFDGTPMITSVTDHGVVLDVSGYQFRADTLLTINLVTNHDIPEPGTLGLMGLGLAGLGLARRRSTRTPFNGRPGQ